MAVSSAACVVQQRHGVFNISTFKSSLYMGARKSDPILNILLCQVFSCLVACLTWLMVWLFARVSKSCHWPKPVIELGLSLCVSVYLLYQFNCPVRFAQGKHSGTCRERAISSCRVITNEFLSFITAKSSGDNLVINRHLNIFQQPFQVKDTWFYRSPPRKKGSKELSCFSRFKIRQNIPLFW